MYETLIYGRGRFILDKTVDKRTVRLLGFRFAAAHRWGGAVDLPAFTPTSAFERANLGVDKLGKV